MGLRIFEFVINPEDEEIGMTAISLVDHPAMESEFIAFNKQEKPQIFKFKDSTKFIVSGLALIPNKLVYRIDETTEEEYLGYFSVETIEAIMNKFMAEATEGSTKAVNLQHSDTKVQAHLIESFILRTPEMVQAVQAMGIEEATIGSWFVSYKFDNQEDYNTALESGMTGFSIEVMLQRELKLNKNNKKINNNIMAKFKTFVDKFKVILSELENENKFEDAVVPESGKSLRIGDVGTPVLWVSTDEAGAEVTEPVIEGSYIVEDGRTIVVDAQGNLVEIKDAGTPVEPINPEGLSAEEIEAACKKKKLEDQKLAENLVDSGSTAQPVASGDTAQPDATADVSAKTLGDLVDVTKDGMYVISVTCMGGAITEATVEAEMDLVKKADFDALKTENDELKLKLANIKVKPIFNEFSIPSEKKVDTSKMSNYELTLHKLGLEK